MKLYLELLLCLGWLTLTAAQGDSDACTTELEGLVEDGCPRTCVVRRESECPRCNVTCARVELRDECVSFERLVSVLDCRSDCVSIDEDTGCPECDETCVTCPPVSCDLFCPNGYQRNEEGCEICECVEDCPVTASELVEQDECSRECIIRMSDRERGCPMCDPECEDVEPECSSDDDCDEDEICVTVGDFGSAKCVDVPSEGESCSDNDDDEDDEDDEDVDETELEEELLAGSSISGVVDRALIDLVGSIEVSCEDGFRCSRGGVCERIEGPCISDPSMPSCDDEGNYRPLQCSAVEGEEGTFLCYCAYPNGTQVPDTERRITEREDAPDCVGIVFDPCKYTLNGQEYAARHGEDVVDFTRCVRCRCRDGELVGCVDTDDDECDAIDGEDEPEGCEFMGRRLAHGERFRVDECNVCGCRDGEVTCTELDCGDDDIDEDDVCDSCRRLARRVVCGADGRNHLSRCFALNCSGLRDIDVLDRPCLLRDICRRYPCSRGETCLRRGGVSCLRRGGCDRDDLRVCVNTTRLRCRNTLSNIDETVCASNGQTYASVCRMLQDTSNVQVDHTGRCDDPRCATGPVCGTDGVTYRNLCVLRSRSANARVDHRGECDEEDETPSDEICARVRATGRCEYNRDNCDRLVRPEEGCCPICGGVAQIALDRSRLQAYVELNPGVATLDDFVESLARAGFFPDGLDDQCEVEISLTRRSNVEIVLRARSASDDDACFQASEMLVERTNDPALALSTVPPELEFTSGAASAPLVEDGGSGASTAAFSYLTLAIACGLTQSFF